MDWLLSFARLTLALLFAVAGATKLADLRGTRQAMVDFGVPDKLSGLCARLLPVFELILAGLLLPMETARLAALGALALLAGIEAGIAGNLALGRTPDCHCFGQLHSKPLSWSLFARNLVLLALAGLIAAYGPGTWGPNAVQSLTAGEALGLFCAAVALAAVVPLWWNLRRLEKEVEGLQELRQLVEQFEYTRIPQAERHGVAPPEEGHPVGAEAPDFLLRNITGEEVALKDVLQPGKLTALMFVSTNCATCRELLPLIKRWDDKHDEFLKIVLISKGSLEENLKRIRAYQTRHLLIHEDSEVAQAYHTRWTPSAVLVDANGRIASPIRVGKGQIRHLIEHTVTLAASKQPGPVRLPEVVLGDSLFKVGDPAPRFALPDLEGRPVSLEQLLDRPNLLVFWTSDCSHCVSLGPELEQWEQGIDPNSPRLVLIASGDAEEIRRILGNLSLLTLMDPDFEIGPLFGVTNTPSAVLVDRFGRIASSLAQGRKRIFTLVGFKPRWANQRPA